MPRLLGGDNDITGNNPQMFIPELSQRLDGRRVRLLHPRMLRSTRRDHGEGANRPGASNVFQEPAVAARHVFPDFLMEGFLLGFGPGAIVRVDIVSLRGMRHAQGHIPKLDQGGLSIASPAPLLPFPLARPLVIKHTPGQTGAAHVFRASQIGTDLVVKNHGVAMVAHAVEQDAHLADRRGELLQGGGDGVVVPGRDGVDGFEHGGDHVGALGFHCDRDAEEPGFILGAREGVWG